jgi:hypothetical protein
MQAAILCMMVALAGCTLHASRQAAPPPAPTPEAAVKQSPAPPLSIPQTSAVLPSPQPVNPDAIPRDPPPREPLPAEKAEVPAARTPPKAGGLRAKQTDTAGTSAPPETEEPAAPAPAVSERAPLQPILSSDQQNQLKSAIAGRKRDVNNLLNKANEHAGNDQTLIDRIHSFLKLSDDAAQRGDYTQADALSERALVLAQELQVE